MRCCVPVEDVWHDVQCDSDHLPKVVFREGVCNANQALAGLASHQPVHVHLSQGMRGFDL